MAFEKGDLLGGDYDQTLFSIIIYEEIETSKFYRCVIIKNQGRDVWIENLPANFLKNNFVKVASVDVEIIKMLYFNNPKLYF